MTIQGNIIDIANKHIFFGQLHIVDGEIVDIQSISAQKSYETFILPGFIDAHIHIESSMLTPSNFARMAVVHGTIGTVSDPHEIANVLGIEGVHYMIEDGKQVPFYFTFGAPSCVPATIFENAGATINSQEIDSLLQHEDIYYLAEMMNFPGVIYSDEEVHKKIALAHKYNKPIDGHAPGLRGDDAIKYFKAGISTDHECFTYEEAKEKLGLGVKILIREGSAAKNFDALIPLARDHSDHMMFCSDDKHPDNLVEGHINQLVCRAVRDHNIDVFDVLKMACINPRAHYGIKSGTLNVGDVADFIIVKDLENFEVTHTYIKGQLVATHGKTLLPYSQSKVVNNFNTKSLYVDDLKMHVTNKLSTIRVIEVLDGQLITNEKIISPTLNGNEVISDSTEDVLKIVVYNRYQQATPAIGFIHGFGLKKGAIASSVAHDSHNIIAVGVKDEDIVSAINEVIKHKGGVCAAYRNECNVLPLEVAGLMSIADGYDVAKKYTAIDIYAKEVLGSKLTSPFMSLSFMALLVIPSLKLSDMGLFDGKDFKFVPLEVLQNP